jgi:uncharacterized membrane protein YcaP (DUF421 family)
MRSGQKIFEREYRDRHTNFDIRQGKELASLQMVLRAGAVFFCLVLIRISGRRSFGQRPVFDCVVAILLGATLSRITVGASPAIPTMAATFTRVVLHRMIPWLCICFRSLERQLVG